MAKNVAPVMTYVPLALKERLDESRRQGIEINTSKLFTAALGAELDALAASGGEQGAAAVAARLRSTISDGRIHAVGERGVARGRKWAEAEATFAQLRNLAGFCKGRDYPFDHVTDLDGKRLEDQRWTGPTLAYSVIAGMAYFEPDPHRVAMFWDRICGPDTELTRPFLRGFVVGAVSVWDEVAPLLAEATGASESDATPTSKPRRRRGKTDTSTPSEGGNR